VEFDEEAGRYDLTLWVFEGAEGLTASWTYSTDLFDEATVARMHEHYEALLRGVAESPETRLRAFDISAAAERAEHADREREQEEALARRLTSSRRRPARRTPGAGQ
jgi:non-ribosomal peptide synthetase component F